MVPTGQFADPGQSEWSNACTVGGRWDTALDVESFSALADGQKCSAHNAADAPGGVSTYPVDAEALAGCKHAAKGYDHLRNMLGNVREWENSCDKTPEAGEPFDDCHTRGASFAEAYAGKPSNITDARCDAPQIQQRNTFSDDLGFRCCGTPTVP
jgi:formylglycine-generating enzyme required for sulfatase activity